MKRKTQIRLATLYIILLYLGFMAVVLHLAGWFL
jgi:hypothetical protein